MYIFVYIIYQSATINWDFKAPEESARVEIYIHNMRIIIIKKSAIIYT
jgi:hypothetical protein